MYSRTQNENGSWNSRCLHCFLTIVSAVETEAELAPLESCHICPERALADLQRRGKLTSPQRPEEAPPTPPIQTLH